MSDFKSSIDPKDFTLSIPEDELESLDNIEDEKVESKIPALAKPEINDDFYSRDIEEKAQKKEHKRRNKIKSLEAEIGKLRARADGETNAGVKTALEQEIQLRQDLIALREQGLAMDAQDEAYYRQRLSNETGQARILIECRRNSCGILLLFCNFSLCT